MFDWLLTHEERSNPLEDPSNPIAKAFLMLGDAGTLTGRAMNERNALALPAFFNGVAIISGDIATIPLKLYRRLDNGGRSEESGHPLWQILTLSPLAQITSTAWREASQAHLLMRGNSYSEIMSNRGGEVTGLVPYNPNDVTRKGEIYEITGPQGVIRRVHASRMLHIPGPGGNGIDGWSVITLARNNLSLTSALEESNTRFIANAAQPSGFLKTTASISPEVAARARSQFAKKAAGLDHVGEIPVLDGDWSFEQTALTAEDAAYIESRKFGVTDVARWLNIPPHKIADLERATFSNVEEMAIDYVQGTLRPWAVRHENVMNVMLLTDRERAQGLFISYNMDGLLRGDVERRTTSYRSQFEVGALTTNEIRALENHNPIEGGDRAFVRLDMVPLDKIDEVQSVGMDDEGRVTSLTFAKRSERRDHQARIALRQAFLAMFLDAAGRMVRGELRNVRRIISRTAAEQLVRMIEAYYFEDHPGFARDVMLPVFRAFAEGVTAASSAEIDSTIQIDTITFSDAYVDSFVANYSANSRRALIGLEDAEQMEQRLSEWQDGTLDSQPRHEQVAQRHLVELGDAVARATWFAGGVATFVWRTIGDSCPYCVRLNGRVVGRSEPFLREGEEFEGEDTDVRLVPKSNIHHAPAHRGCNCTIVPG